MVFQPGRADPRVLSAHAVAATAADVPARVYVTAAVLGVATGVLRYLALVGFSNDHYLFLAGAQQMLMGEWPTRDFVDPGMPLMYGTSAAAQVLLGHTLFAEAVLVVLAFGIASAAVVCAAWMVSRSLVTAIAASGLSMIAFPRSYGYPKLLLYATVPLLIWSWVRIPTVGRLLAIALGVCVAFLFRHDHGVYLAIAALATIALQPDADAGTRWRHVAIVSGLFALLLLPYLAYRQVHLGIVTYLQEALAFAQREGDRTRLSLSDIAPGHETRLFYLFHVLPLAVVGWLLADWRRGWSTDHLMSVPLVISGVLVNATFLRDPLAVRARAAAPARTRSETGDRVRDRAE